jgi:hypothetical protein
MLASPTLLRWAVLALLLLQTGGAARPRGYYDHGHRRSGWRRGGFLRRGSAYRRQRPFQHGYRAALPAPAPPTAFLETRRAGRASTATQGRLGLSGGEAAMQLGIGSTDRYPGQPEMQYDGTEGNGAFYAGNYQPGFVGDANNPHTSFGGRKGQGAQYWHDNPYWDYFKQVWGAAPFIDANFRLWMSGYMKKFPGASHHLEDGNTNVLPTWLGYTHEKYDPLTDPPYRSTEDIFGGKMKEAAEDCSQPFGPYALGYKRPCAKSGSEGADREREAKSHMMAQHKAPTGDVLGKNTWWNRLPTETRWGAGTNYYLHKAPSGEDAKKSQIDSLKSDASGLDTPGEPGSEAIAQIPVPGQGSESGVFGWKKDIPAPQPVAAEGEAAAAG